jgi:hypothetical protein
LELFNRLFVLLIDISSVKLNTVQINIVFVGNDKKSIHVVSGVTFILCAFCAWLSAVYKRPPLDDVTTEVKDTEREIPVDHTIGDTYM